jgi:hypothetical protein
MLRRISSLFNSSGSKQSKRADSAFNYPTSIEAGGGGKIARKLCNELKLGNWHIVHAFLEKEASPIEKHFYLDTITSSPFANTSKSVDRDRPGWVDDWTAAFPDSSLSWQMRGFFGKNWAWELLDLSTGFVLDEDQQRVFDSRLQVAEKDLMKAIEMDASDANPWAMLIWTGIGLRVPLDTIQERLGAVMERNPDHRAAYAAALQSLTVKRGGSKTHDLMFAFARKVLTDAPEGSGLHSLICEAHCERYATIESPEEQDEYFQQNGVMNEIIAAAENSVLSRKYEENVYSIYDRNYFAFCLAQCHAYELALQQFEALGPSIVPTPWMYFDEPIEAYASIYDGCINSLASKS